VALVSERTEIDKGAAGRFIKHAITQATYGKAPSDTLEPTSSKSTFVKPKITGKMLERQQYEKELRERDAEESEEEVLEGFEDGDVSMDVDATVPSAGSKGKGKSREDLPTIEEPTTQPNNKRRRPVIDPFAGIIIGRVYGRSLTHFRLWR
jgi:exosome complex protein LRP1